MDDKAKKIAALNDVFRKSMRGQRFISCIQPVAHNLMRIVFAKCENDIFVGEEL